MSIINPVQFSLKIFFSTLLKKASCSTDKTMEDTIRLKIVSEDRLEVGIVMKKTSPLGKP